MLSRKEEPRAASVSSTFLACYSTCEHEHCVNWFIHENQLSQTHRIKGLYKELHLTAAENSQTPDSLNNTARTFLGWGVTLRPATYCQCSRVLIKKKEGNDEDRKNMGESTTEEAVTHLKSKPFFKK